MLPRLLLSHYNSESQILLGFSKAVHIPCLTCPTWSGFIQDKLEISIYSSWDKFEESLYNSVFHIR